MAEKATSFIVYVFSISGASFASQAFPSSPDTKFDAWTGDDDGDGGAEAGRDGEGEAGGRDDRVPDSRRYPTR